MPKKKDNIINFPSAPSKLERQVEAIFLQLLNHLILKQLKKEFKQIKY